MFVSDKASLCNIGKNLTLEESPGRCSICVGSGLIPKHCTGLERLVRDKHKLIREICKYEEKSVVNMVTQFLYDLMNPKPCLY